jgi:hypothetical protein
LDRRKLEFIAQVFNVFETDNPFPQALVVMSTMRSPIRSGKS